MGAVFFAAEFELADAVFIIFSEFVALLGELADGVRMQLLEGTWNATHVLLEANESIEQIAAAIPYLNDFPG